MSQVTDRNKKNSAGSACSIVLYLHTQNYGAPILRWF